MLIYWEVPSCIGCGNVNIDQEEEIEWKELVMDRKKVVAIITGAISIVLAIAYLIIVQILDYRDMQPAPIGQIYPVSTIVVFADQANYTNTNYSVFSSSNLN